MFGFPHTKFTRLRLPEPESGSAMLPPGRIPGIFGEKNRRIQPAIRAKKNPRGSLRRHFPFITSIIYILRGIVKTSNGGQTPPSRLVSTGNGRLAGEGVQPMPSRLITCHDPSAC